MNDSTWKECFRLWGRIVNNYEILLQRRDKETTKKLTELGIEFNEKLAQWNSETEKILREKTN